MSQGFILQKVDWPKSHCFNIVIGDHALRTAGKHFTLKPEDPIYMVKPGTTWSELLDALGLIGERGVFPSITRAEQDGWVGEISPGTHERPLNCRKKYRIRVLRVETPDDSKHITVDEDRKVAGIPHDVPGVPGRSIGAGAAERPPGPDGCGEGKTVRDDWQGPV